MSDFVAIETGQSEGEHLPYVLKVLKWEMAKGLKIKTNNLIG